MIRMRLFSEEARQTTQHQRHKTSLLASLGATATANEGGSQQRHGIFLQPCSNQMLLVLQPPICSSSNLWLTVIATALLCLTEVVFLPEGCLLTHIFQQQVWLVRSCQPTRNQGLHWLHLKIMTIKLNQRKHLLKNKRKLLPRIIGNRSRSHPVLTRTSWM